MICSDDLKYFEEIFPFWTKLSQAEKNYLIINSRAMSYKKDFNLHHSPECNGLIILKEGSLRVHMASEDAREITIQNLHEVALEIITTDYDVKEDVSIFISALEDSEVIVINIEAFNKIKERNIYVEQFYSKLMYKKLSKIINVLESVIFTPLDKRLANFLISHKEDTINISHDEIARNIGSSREVISRKLKVFSQNNLISSSRNQIKILSREKLENI